MILANGRPFGTLAAVVSWARADVPDAVLVEADGEISGPGTGWDVPVPLTIKGGTWVGEAGWWLSHRVPTPLVVSGVTVRGWSMGGLDAGSPDRRRGSVVVQDSVFSDLGGGPGYAAVFATDCDVLVQRCRFRHLVQDPDGSWLHAVYGIRSRLTVLDCDVNTCSGDPLRARDGTTLIVERTRSRHAGVQALASTWQRPGEAPSTVSTRDCRPGRTFTGRPALAAYQVR